MKSTNAWNKLIKLTNASRQLRMKRWEKWESYTCFFGERESNCQNSQSVIIIREREKQ